MLLSNSDRSKRTYEFLKCIAQHLSYRDECRDVEYTLCIGVDVPEGARQLDFVDIACKEDGTRIHFYPNIDVFKSTHNRKPSDSTDVVSHVILYHFQNSVYSHTDNFGFIHMNEDSLIKGVYMYKKRYGTNRRKWVKLS